MSQLGRGLSAGPFTARNWKHFRGGWRQPGNTHSLQSSSKPCGSQRHFQQSHRSGFSPLNYNFNQLREIKYTLCLTGSNTFKSAGESDCNGNGLHLLMEVRFVSTLDFGSAEMVSSWLASNCGMGVVMSFYQLL